MEIKKKTKLHSWGGLNLYYCVAKNSDNIPYPLFGVNVNLMKWIRCDHEFVERTLRKALPYKDKIENFYDTMLEIFGGSLGHDFQKAEEYIYRHWHAYSELGPYPCPGLLSKYQTEGVFYSSYRDHVVHQLRTYILGLYIYQHCEGIRNALHTEIRNDANRTIRRSEREEFLLRWLATALSHDVGYVLENKTVQPEREGNPEMPGWENFKKEFNELLKYPLLGPCDLDRKIRPDSAKLKAFKEIHDGIWSCKSHSIGASETLGNLPQYNPDADKAPKDEGNGAAWAVLDPAGFKANFSLGETNILKTYYSFTKRVSTDYNEKLPDHGISSAMILLRSWYAYRDVLCGIKTKIIKNEEVPLLNQNMLTPLRDGQWWNNLDVSTIHAAATAIALHNIDMRRYSKENRPTEWIGVFNERLNICLEGEKSQALAWLLRLCDTIQQWDRQQFKPLKPSDRVMSSKDISVLSDKDGIKLFFCADSPPYTIHNGILEDLKIAIDDDSVKKYVHRNEEDIKDFRELNYSDWRPKEPQDNPPLLPVSEDQACIIRKIQSTLAIGRPIIPVGVCRNTAMHNGTCPVRLQLLHHAAESTRLGGEIHETTQVLNIFNRIVNESFLLDSYGPIIKSAQETIGSFVRVSLGNLAIELGEFVHFFQKVRRIGYRSEIVLKERITNFLSLRSIGDVSCPRISQAVLDLHKYIGDDKINGHLRRTTKKKSDLGEFVQSLQPNIHYLGHAAQHTRIQLSGVLENRSKHVFDRLHDSLAEKDFENLGTYISGIIKSLPHNNPEAGCPPIWKRKREEELV